MIKKNENAGLLYKSQEPLEPTSPRNSDRVTFLSGESLKDIENQDYLSAQTEVRGESKDKKIVCSQYTNPKKTTSQEISTSDMMTKKCKAKFKKNDEIGEGRPNSAEIAALTDELEFQLANLVTVIFAIEHSRIENTLFRTVFLEVFSKVPFHVQEGPPSTENLSSQPKTSQILPSRDSQGLVPPRDSHPTKKKPNHSAKKPTNICSFESMIKKAKLKSGKSSAGAQTITYEEEDSSSPATVIINKPALKLPRKMTQEFKDSNKSNKSNPMDQDKREEREERDEERSVSIKIEESKDDEESVPLDSPRLGGPSLQPPVDPHSPQEFSKRLVQAENENLVVESFFDDPKELSGIGLLTGTGGVSAKKISLFANKNTSSKNVEIDGLNPEGETIHLNIMDFKQSVCIELSNSMEECFKADYQSKYIDQHVPKKSIFCDEDDPLKNIDESPIKPSKTIAKKKDNIFSFKQPQASSSPLKVSKRSFKKANIDELDHRSSSIDLDKQYKTFEPKNPENIYIETRIQPSNSSRKISHGLSSSKGRVRQSLASKLLKKPASRASSNDVKFISMFQNPPSKTKPSESEYIYGLDRIDSAPKPSNDSRKASVSRQSMLNKAVPLKDSKRNIESVEIPEPSKTPTPLSLQKGSRNSIDSLKMNLKVKRHDTKESRKNSKSPLCFSSTFTNFKYQKEANTAPRKGGNPSKPMVSRLTPPARTIQKHAHKPANPVELQTLRSPKNITPIRKSPDKPVGPSNLAKAKSQIAFLKVKSMMNDLKNKARGSEIINKPPTMTDLGGTPSHFSTDGNRKPTSNLKLNNRVSPLRNNMGDLVYNMTHSQVAQSHRVYSPGFGNSPTAFNAQSPPEKARPGMKSSMLASSSLQKLESSTSRKRLKIDCDEFSNPKNYTPQSETMKLATQTHFTPADVKGALGSPVGQFKRPSLTGLAQSNSSVRKFLHSKKSLDKASQ